MAGEQTYMLNYWRKKYLRQAILVVILATAVVWLSFVFFDYIGFKILLAAVGVVVTYLMFKAIREDLQARGEGIILAKSDALFHGIRFDFGRGIDENTLLRQDVIPAYKLRECYNVLKGNNFILEEDWF